MAKEYQIKWKQTDYLTLGRAVSKFNKVKNELARQEKDAILPATLDYKEVKENIKTRKQLNNLLSSLRKFGKEDSLQIYETSSGDKITMWEHRELEKEKNRIVRRLNKKLEKYTTPNEQGFTRVQMGSSEARKIMEDIEKFKNYEMQKGYDFKVRRDIIHSIGDIDYEFRKATTYRENYINEMKKYSHFDNYELLKQKMEELKNPKEFFEYFSKDEITVDLTYQSDQFYAQQDFNSFLERLGIDIEEDTINSEERG